VGTAASLALRGLSPPYALRFARNDAVGVAAAQSGTDNVPWLKVMRSPAAGVA